MKSPEPITINFKGTERELVSSVAVAKKVNALGLGSGFQEVLRRVQASDFDTCVAILSAAFEVRDNKAAREVEEFAYSYGVVEMREKLMRYIYRLANGGRDADTEPETPEEGNE